MNILTKTLSATAIILSVSGCTAITDFTSSTSSTLDAVTPDVTVNEFVDKRYIAIRKEAANGGGENLDALAQLMGKDDTRSFAKLMKNNFESIFTQVDKPQDIIARIEEKTTLNNG